METSASFEARYAPLSHPTAGPIRDDRAYRVMTCPRLVKRSMLRWSLSWLWRLSRVRVLAPQESIVTATSSTNVKISIFGLRRSRPAPVAIDAAALRA